MNRKIFYLYLGKKLLLIPPEHRDRSLTDLTDHITQYDRMIFMNDSLNAHILNVWSKFDQKEFINFYFNETKRFCAQR